MRLEWSADALADLDRCDGERLVMLRVFHGREMRDGV
jgi:hypothetical protein